MLDLKNIFADKKSIAAVVFIAVVSVILLIQSYGKATRDSGYDFTSYIYASALLAEQQNPYDPGAVLKKKTDYPKPPFPYIYPLTAAFLLTPFNYIPYQVSVVIWFIGGLISLLVTIHVLSNSASKDKSFFHKRTGFPVFSALIILLLINIIQNNFLNGQINFVILLLLVLCYRSYAKGSSITAAFLLALAVSIKLTPALFLLYFLINREYKLVLFSLIFIPVLILLPYLAAGNKIWEFYFYYYSHFLVEPGQNQNSLLGIAGSAYAKFALLTFIIAMLAFFSLFYRKNRAGLNELNIFSVYFLFLLLLTPKLQTHTLVFILPAFQLFLIQVMDYHKKLKKAYIYILPPAALSVFYVSRATDAFNLVYLTIIILLIYLLLNLNSLRHRPASG